MGKTAFEKRVKRKIVGRDHTFFASCAPGLKSLLADEIAGLGLDPTKIIKKKGGIEFTGRMHDCYRANLHLRIPIRILMRIADFKAENFSTLDRKIKAINWELFLLKNSELNIRVSTHKSRLYHSDAIAQRVERTVSEKLKTIDRDLNQQEKKSVHDLFIRSKDDRFEVSLDSSGKMLFKRGIKENTIDAPLRENLAWAALKHAGFTKNDVLIDPMCGSGTFSLEASMFKQNIPPGFYRDFAFFNFQGFRKERWEYIKKQAKSNFNSNSQTDIFASDIDDKSVAGIKNNIKKYNFDKTIAVNQIDFFDITPETLTGEKGLVILNPPYGKRIGSRKDISAFYNETGKKLVTDFKGWKFGIIMPEKHLLSKYSFRSKTIRSFFHGGLDIFLITGVI